MKRSLGLGGTIAAAALALGPTGPAHAFVSSRTFAQDCVGAEAPAQLAECQGYVAGIADALNGNIVKGMKVCVPKNVGQAEMRASVVKWIQANPHLRGFNGLGLVTAALTKTYPCR